MGGPYSPPGGPPAQPAYVRRRRRGVVWPGILIALGIILLLQNFGLLSWAMWGSLWRFWPVILVLIGLELFLEGSARAVVGLLFAGLLIIAAVALATGAWFGGSEPPARSQTLAQALEGARSANVMVRFGAGNLDVGALQGEGQLASMTYQGPPWSQPEARYRVRDGQGQLTYSVRHSGPPFQLPFGRDGGKSQMDLLLSPDVPLSLDIQEGASDGRLDLSQLRVTNLQLQTGASHINVVMPSSAGNTSAVIKGCAATIDVEVPPGVAAQIQYEGGLSSVNIDQSRFPLVGDRTYRSADYESAANRVDLSIRAGVATINVR